MTNPHQSPVPTECRRALRPLSRSATISILLLSWIASWLMSMLSFGNAYGGWELYADRKTPIDEWLSHWVVYALAVCPIALPVSTYQAVTAILSWLPAAVTPSIAFIVSAAFWPVYITFFVLALRTGKRRHLAVLVVVGLFASIYWHIVCMPWLGV